MNGKTVMKDPALKILEMKFIESACAITGFAAIAARPFLSCSSVDSLVAVFGLLLLIRATISAARAKQAS